MTKPTLAVATALGALSALAACTVSTPAVAVGAPQDPCVEAYYDGTLCQQAISQHGYYYGGTFYPVTYAYPLGFYSSRYNTYVVHGGVWHRPSAAVYSRTYTRTTVRSTTGGFGGGAAVRSGTPVRAGGSAIGSSGTVRGGFGGSAARTGSFGGGSFGG